MAAYAAPARRVGKKPSPTGLWENMPNKIKAVFLGETE